MKHIRWADWLRSARKPLAHRRSADHRVSTRERDMTHSLRVAGALVVAGLLAGTVPAVAQEIELHGATQFNDNHAFNKALLKFQEVTAPSSAIGRATLRES